MKKLLLLTIVGLFSLEAFAANGHVYHCYNNAVYKDGAYFVKREGGCSSFGSQFCSSQNGAWNPDKQSCTIDGFVNPSVFSGLKMFIKK